MPDKAGAAERRIDLQPHGDGNVQVLRTDKRWANQQRPFCLATVGLRGFGLWLEAARVSLRHEVETIRVLQVGRL